MPKSTKNTDLPSSMIFPRLQNTLYNTRTGVPGEKTYRKINIYIYELTINRL